MTLNTYHGKACCNGRSVVKAIILLPALVLLFSLPQASGSVITGFDQLQYSGSFIMNVSGTLDIKTNDLSRIYVTQSGNVGIGKSNPLEQLDINGAVRIGTTSGTNAGTIRYVSNIFQGYNGSAWLTLSGGAVDVGWVHEGGIVSLMNSSDKVGMGTMSPLEKLDVADRMRLRSGTSGKAGIWFANTTASNAFIGLETDTAGSEKIGIYQNGWGLIVDSSARVGVNTTTPNQALSVAGNVNVTGTAYAGNVTTPVLCLNGDCKTAWPAAGTSPWTNDTNYIYIAASYPTSVNVTGTLYASNVSSNSPLQLQTGGTTRVYINDSTGNVGIGTTSPGVRLEVIGAINSTDWTNTTSFVQAIATATNTTMKGYVDGKDTATNTSATGYASSLNTATNTSMKNYADARFGSSLDTNGNNIRLLNPASTVLATITAPYATAAGTVTNGLYTTTTFAGDVGGAYNSLAIGADKVTAAMLAHSIDASGIGFNADTTDTYHLNQDVTSSGTPTFNGLSANSQKITNVLTPTASTDAATKGYVDSLASSSVTKSQVFTATGTFTVPTNVTLVWVTAVGGGGGGAGGDGCNPCASYCSGAGGGAGEIKYRIPVNVTSAGTVSVTIGGGGTGAAGRNCSTPSSGSAGTATTFGSAVSAAAGGGGANCGPGGDGGGILGAKGGSFGVAGANAVNSTAFVQGGAGGGGGNGGGSGAAGGSAPCFGTCTGGSGGSYSSCANGGGGGAGFFGNGANGGSANGGTNGASAAANSGAGGGGGGQAVSSVNSGNGGNGGTGILMVEWIAP